MKQRLTVLAVLVLIAGISGIYGIHHQEGAKASTDNTAANGAFDKKQLSLTDPNSIWIVVNKQRPLKPQNYAPADLVFPDLPLRVPGNESMQLRKVTADALTTLFAASKADDVPLMVSSGYRSYSYQVALYGKYVREQGQRVADTQSARPGYSEHQTGLAVDVEPVSQQCEVEQCFADLPAGKWVAANAYKYGFIIRYAKGKTLVTGYEYEPWHLRYIGTELATEMHKRGIATLEEFFGLPSAPDY